MCRSAEAAAAIRNELLQVLTTPEVAVTVLQTSAQQLLDGEHLVGPDGRVNLGIYGRYHVAGLTLDEAQIEIQRGLEAFCDGPQISIDVFVYNSKFFYVISEGGGLGENVARIPSTGNETVLDAIATVGGLDSTASTKIWIARPAPQGVGCDQILPVDWKAITRGGAPGTNYQLLPGDRLFIAQDRLIAFNSFAAKLLNPFERMFGFSLLGAQTVQTLQRFPEGLLFR
jgi:protein involved in polysaccharide export with SLBB domain